MIDEEQVREYEVMYRRDGLNALLSIWAWEGGPLPLLITGMHRSTAANRAGLNEILAWVVQDD